jgi:hypothetical protein
LRRERKEHYLNSGVPQQTLESRVVELGKVKSESSIKMDEILMSYNNYKLNKEQFISEMQESSRNTHHRNYSTIIS